MSWQKRLESLKERVRLDRDVGDNFDKRVLYSEVELLKMDLEELCNVGGDVENPRLGSELDRCLPSSASSASSSSSSSASTPSKGGAVGMEEQIRLGLEALTSLEDALKLGFVRRRRQWWDRLDEATRLVGVCLCLVLFSIVCSPLGLLLRPLDFVLVSARVLPPHLQASLLLKRGMGYVLLWAAGVVLVEEGLEGGSEAFFESHACVLCCFSHASTLDAFIIAGALGGVVLLCR